MNATKAIFKKQLKATGANPESVIMFIIFPLLALAINAFINQEGMVEDMTAQLTYFDAYLSYDVIEAAVANMAAEMAGAMPNMVTMQATIFAGMALIPIVAGIIADDIERKSLRFLSMAGVKPGAYLIGVGGVILFLGFFSSMGFTLVGSFFGMDMLIFMGAMLTAVAGSIMLGATIGILCRNVQAASGLSMLAAIVIGFGPIFAQFSDGIARVYHVFYTQQLNIIADYLNFGYTSTPLWESFAIMWANIAVLVVLFVLAYRKKGIMK